MGDFRLKIKIILLIRILFNDATSGLFNNSLKYISVFGWIFECEYVWIVRVVSRVPVLKRIERKCETNSIHLEINCFRQPVLRNN